MTAQAAAAAYADRLAELAPDLPRKIYQRNIGHVARRAKDALDAGANPDLVVAAARRLADRGLSPSQYDLMLVDVAVKHGKQADPVRQRVQEELDKGWPTGCKFVRGSHSGTHEPDPLGRDRPPTDWPHPRPTRHDIERAVRKLLQP